MFASACQFGVGVALGYVVASVAESFLHKYIGHAPARRLRRWRKHPRLFATLLRAHYSHLVIHHGRTFRRDFVTQFVDEAERVRLDGLMRPEYRDYVRARGYGTTLRGLSVVRFVAPVAPAVVAIHAAFGPWAAAGSLLPIGVVYPLMSMAVHPLLHKPPEVLAGAGVVTSWLLRTPYVRAVLAHHFVHHRHPGCNFNLLLGGDYVLGVHRKPSPDDVAAMRRIGLRV